MIATDLYRSFPRLREIMNGSRLAASGSALAPVRAAAAALRNKQQ
jgi:hypothetical protein